ncbi:MAG: efflux RND transporter periplasmic adaptor subunit [Candidatus Krumholzibacteria bacterium]|jgi:membrane fusion protein (multidrug efflux system)|nr:efflux RND transporter periplasmic adaptor subunit [Candidatus Krumholzibacteria bacterium]
MRNLSVVLAIVLLVAACGGRDQSAPQAGAQAGQAAGSGPAGSGGGLGAAALPPAPVVVAPVAVGSIASYYRATASLEAEKQAEVLARAVGLVEAILVEEGDAVAAGQQLLRIDNDEYRFRVEQAAARTSQVAAAFERLSQMRAEQLASEQEFESARADLASAQAEEGLARLDLSYTTVVAPFAGVVTQRLVDPGQNVGAGTPLFRLAAVRPLLARVHVPSREFRQLQVNQEVQLVLDSTRERLTGRITLISPVIDPSTGTIKVTVEVPRYPVGTRPGDFAEVRIVTELREEAILVPRVAVVIEKGESVVYTALVGDEPRAERRVVTVGFTDDDRAQILTGLEPGDQAVVKGQRSLRHGQPLRIVEDA